MAESISSIRASGGDYTTLAAWEAGEQGYMNTDTRYVAEVYGDVDAGSVTIDGWSNNSSSRHVWIRAAAGEGHSGVWSDTAARATGGYQTIDVDETYTRISDMQIATTTDDNNIHGINVKEDAVCTIERCIIKGQTDIGSYGSNQIGIFAGTDRTNDLDVINCIIYDFNDQDNTDNAGIKIVNVAGGDSSVSNCTIVNCYYGITDGYADIRVRNTLISGGNTCFNGSNKFGSDYNAASDATAPGSNSRDSQTFTFNDAASDDYRITTSDTGAYGYGTDLSADFYTPFSDDIVGTTRTGTWDIGANVAISGGGGGGPAYIQAQVIMVT